MHLEQILKPWYIWGGEWIYAVFCYHLLTPPFLLQEAAKFFPKRPDGKYFQLCRPNGLSHGYQFSFGAEKQPRTMHTRTGVVVQNLTYKFGQKPGFVMGLKFSNPVLELLVS